MTIQTVGKWRQRFITDRMAGLDDRARSGTPRTISDERVERIITLTFESKPENATHLSTRSMAKGSGLTHDAVHWIWKPFGLQPHRQETFRFLTDPVVIQKVRDVVGLYMSPATHALVLSVYEKSQRHSSQTPFSLHRFIRLQIVYQCQSALAAVATCSRSPSHSAQRS